VGIVANGALGKGPFGPPLGPPGPALAGGLGRAPSTGEGRSQDQRGSGLGPLGPRPEPKWALLGPFRPYLGRRAKSGGILQRFQKGTPKGPKSHLILGPMGPFWGPFGPLKGPLRGPFRGPFGALGARRPPEPGLHRHKEARPASGGQAPPTPPREGQNSQIVVVLGPGRPEYASGRRVWEGPGSGSFGAPGGLF